MGTSEKDTMKAYSAPACTPGMMVGRVMRRNVLQRLAPMLNAASSRRMLKRCKTDTTVPIT